jgi:hypothetical protein
VKAIPAIARGLLDVPGDVLARPHGNCYWLIAGQLLAGEHPGAMLPSACIARIDAMLDTGVRQFIDLTDEGEGPGPYVPGLFERAGTHRLRVAHRRFVIPDYGVPSVSLMRAALDTIYAAIAERELVYLHCWGGVGRTGTMVGCMLREQGFTAARALALIGRKWLAMEKRMQHPNSPETAEQVAFIQQWRAV